MNIKTLLGKRRGNIGIASINTYYEVGCEESYKVSFVMYEPYSGSYETSSEQFATKKEFISWLIKHKFIKLKDIFLDLL